MSGFHSYKKTISKWFLRKNYTIYISLAGWCLSAFIVFALYDFVQTAKTKDEQLQSAGLSNELAQFILALKEDDGYPLLDNPKELSKFRRELKVITLRKPFYSYFLNTNNSKFFDTKNIQWDMPRSCAVEFPAIKIKDNDLSTDKLRVCLATIQDDTNGRYIYFSLKYPKDKITRHQLGQNMSLADSISFNLKGERELKLNLVFHPSAYAISRYPSQHERFNGLHEVTAYTIDNNQLPIKSVNAQAYEQTTSVETPYPQNYITILGRINASLVYPSLENNESWPSSKIKDLKTSIRINSFDGANKKTNTMYDIPYKSYGNGVVSLEQLYVSLISSKANLDISTEKQLVWRSDVLKELSIGHRGIIQRVSDWWAQKILDLAGYKKNEAIIHKQILLNEPYYLSLKAEKNTVPDIATRSFLWLWLALIFSFIFSYICFKAISRIQKITNMAYRLTARPTADVSLEIYAANHDQIGILARTFNLLFTRARSRNIRLISRMKMEEHTHNETVRIVKEQVKSRQAVLDAIGHEIKSPLQSLLLKITPGMNGREEVERMQRAIDALYEATSVESGIQSGTIVVQSMDIAIYLKQLVQNLEDIGKKIVYKGPEDSIFATFDPLVLITVLENILDNAYRHKILDSHVQVTLESTNEGAKIGILNFGDSIPSDELESIFSYGVTTHLSPENKGIGLFSARSNLAGMRGTIHAENHGYGVAFIIILPSIMDEILS